MAVFLFFLLCALFSPAALASTHGFSVSDFSVTVNLDPPDPSSVETRPSTSSSIAERSGSDSDPPDIIAVLPDRSTAYPNGVHNGLLLTARALNLTLEIREVGNFDSALSAHVLHELINAPQAKQPRIYLVWPIDYPSRLLLKELWLQHQVPIVQMNQLPDAESQWEWDHLVGYAGPDDALRASNAGKMMLSAMEERKIENPKVVALGYPDTYGGYHLSMSAFEEATSVHPNLTLVEKLPLPWGTQPAYVATLQLLDLYGSSLDGIYAMDDSILMGAYQAILDHPSSSDVNITLVGTVCNGARELLETKAQYGTTVQGPYLEGDLAVRAAAEYLQQSNQTQPFVQFTPNPIITADTWDALFLEYNGESYTADQLCTWTIPYERVAGVEEVDNVNDICAMVHCDYIPRALLYVGLTMCGINYGLALASVLGIYFYRQKAVIQLAQPFFLVLVAIGAAMDNTSILLLSQDNYNRESSPEHLDAVCMAVPWVLSLGHMMTTATLVAKIYRVKQVIGTATRGGFRKNSKPVTVGSVLFFIGAFLSVDVLVLVLWSVLDPMQWQIVVSSYDQNGYIAEAQGQCTWSTEYGFVFPLILGLFHLATLIYANVLAYQTSTYHKISDSHSTAIALFNSIQLLVIVFPLLVVVDDNVGVSYFISVCFVFLNNFGVLVLVVIPKLYKCLIGQGNNVPDLHAMSKKIAQSHQNGGKRNQSRISGLNNNISGNSTRVAISACGPPIPNPSNSNNNPPRSGGKVSFASIEGVYSDEPEEQRQILARPPPSQEAPKKDDYPQMIAPNDSGETDDDHTPNSNHNHNEEVGLGGFVPFLGTETSIMDQFFLGSELFSKLQDEANPAVYHRPGAAS